MTMRRNFYAFLCGQRHRQGLTGVIVRGAIANGRRFTVSGIQDWMLVVRGGLDVEHDALNALIQEYRERTQDEVPA